MKLSADAMIFARRLLARLQEAEAKLAGIEARL